ncbi:hypothetical protein CAPTEDRAFT_214119 [Capitella teleta]|uniref:C2H2-type domain-containing protein n=1 Tax=Capitella teleta TaxID=283909 RepID=R7TKV2_CAPTE|nr:hypothetical protein CAPTEDRAFT_214119 [Capitella teleta]|eukprot:ELT94142.1 hypothetical protein CAPTEDRAFT_214119 [Capitella teleta]
MSNDSPSKPVEHPLLPPKKHDQPLLYTPRNERYLRNMMENSNSSLPIACNPQSSLLYLAYKLRKAQLEMNGNVQGAVAGQAYDRKNPPPPVPRPVSAPVASAKPQTATVAKPKPLQAPSLWPFLVDGKCPDNFDFFPYSVGGKFYVPQPMTDRERSNVEAKAINVTIKMSPQIKIGKNVVESKDGKGDEESEGSFQNVPSIAGVLYKYGCPVCDYETSNKSHLRRHQAALHDLLLPYVCSICEKEFVRIEQVKRHFEEEHPKDEYDPKLCHRLIKAEEEQQEEEVDKVAGEELVEKVEMKEEKQRGSVDVFMSMPNTASLPPETLRCPKCTFTSNGNAGLLRRHMTAAHPKCKEFICPQCHCKTNSRERLLAHMKTHDKLICIYCKCVTFNIPDYQVHVRECSRQNRSKIRATQFKCKFCHVIMPNKTLLCQHAYKRHLVELEFCSLCEFNTGSKKIYEDHMRSHTDQSFHNPPTSLAMYACSICYKRFRTRREKHEHFNKVHTIAPKRCDQCSFHSTNAKFLKMHKYLHANNTCTYKGCSYCTDCSDTMEAHLIKHGQANHKPLPYNVGSFKCPVCKVPAYRYRKSYFHHMKNHPKDVCCPLCHEVFYTVEMMRDHMLMWHDHLNLDDSEPPLEEGIDQDPIHIESDEDDVIMLEEQSEEEEQEEEEEEEEERAVSPIVIEPREDDDFAAMSRKRASSIALSLMSSKRKPVVVLVPLKMESFQSPNGFLSSPVKSNSA